MDTPINIEDKDIEKVDEMLKNVSLEFDNKHKETDEYKTLYDKARKLYPDMPAFFIQMALLSHLEEVHNSISNI